MIFDTFCDKKVYRIVMLDKTSIGDRLKLTIRAREREIDDLENKRVYEVYSGSFTTKRFFDLVFKDTGYKYKLTHKINAKQFEKIGDSLSNTSSNWLSKILSEAQPRCIIANSYLVKIQPGQTKSEGPLRKPIFSHSDPQKLLYTSKV